MTSRSPHPAEKQCTDQELVARTLENKQEFVAIVARYEAALLRYIFRMGCRSSAIAKDLLQEIFIKSYLHLNDYDPALRFSSWIYRIAHNEIVTAFRKERCRPFLVEQEKDLFLFEKVIDDFDLIVEDHQAHTPDDLRRALDRLDSRSREIIILKFFEDKRYEEISDILQIPQGTVATLINRAKKKIKHILDGR